MIDAEHFAVTYGDGVTNADLTAEFAYHLGEPRLGTVLGVNPPSRFGELKIEADAVCEFDEIRHNEKIDDSLFVMPEAGR